MENKQTFEQHLVQAGLSNEQARLYESLIKNGPSLASDAARRAAISRTLAYKVFAELAALGLVEKREESGKVALFTAAHPLKLKEIIEKREQEAKDALTVLDGVLGQMTSEYNIAGGRPGVRFFEGPIGIQEVLSDSLRSKTEILSYVDVEKVEQYFREVNAEYLKKRERLNVQKRLLVLDTPFTRDLYQKDATANNVTHVRLLQPGKIPFGVALQIYDGRISYLTLTEKDNLIGVIIDNPQIYDMHRFLFETLYEKSPALTLAEK